MTLCEIEHSNPMRIRCAPNNVLLYNLLELTKGSKSATTSSANSAE